ncbi:MAG TPA: protoheme IX farnesyltransferase [Leptolyngbyaceae cyanobacterium M65_K2018_010]|nr:protoheme IX farnesyltransferase [Leptolyngbyaceae cyanobacterium M65_K2018_010]
MNQTTTWNHSTRHHDSIGSVIRSYLQLTKPRIIPLLLIETAAAMWVAGQGQVNPLLLVITLVSGTLAAAAAQTINCVYDRDIDFDMERTRHRPIPAGRIQVRDALVFAAILAVLAFVLLALGANLLSASLAMLGIAIYVGVYTHWLKRSSPQNIVIGGAAGAVPPLVGWAAVTGELSLAAWLFFFIVFIWTPPHFWGLAMLIQDDYAKVKVPMMPVVVGDASTARQIWYYTLVLVPLTVMMTFPLGATGTIYALVALLLGGLFIKKAWALLQDPGDRDLAKELFKYSILYMMLLSAGMVVDSWPMTRSLTAGLLVHLEPLLSILPL